jgi:hypothetical protein
MSRSPRLIPSPHLAEYPTFFGPETYNTIITWHTNLINHHLYQHKMIEKLQILYNLYQHNYYIYGIQQSEVNQNIYEKCVEAIKGFLPLIEFLSKPILITIESCQHERLFIHNTEICPINYLDRKYLFMITNIFNQMIDISNQEIYCLLISKMEKLYSDNVINRELINRSEGLNQSPFGMEFNRSVTEIERLDNHEMKNIHQSHILNDQSIDPKIKHFLHPRLYVDIKLLTERYKNMIYDLVNQSWSTEFNQYNEVVNSLDQSALEYIFKQSMIYDRTQLFPELPKQLEIPSREKIEQLLVQLNLDYIKNFELNPKTIPTILDKFLGDTSLLVLIDYETNIWFEEKFRKKRDYLTFFKFDWNLILYDYLNPDIQLSLCSIVEKLLSDTTSSNNRLMIYYNKIKHQGIRPNQFDPFCVSNHCCDITCQDGGCNNPYRIECHPYYQNIK